MYEKHYVQAIRLVEFLADGKLGIIRSGIAQGVTRTLILKRITEAASEAASFYAKAKVPFFNIQEKEVE